jgi:hypothetical protein
MLNSAATGGAARVPHPGRRALDVQPEPIEFPRQHPKQRWSVTAIVERQMTGNAVGWSREEPKKFSAATKDEVLSKRAEFIDAYLHAAQKAKRPTEGRPKPDEPHAQRAKRGAAPSVLTDRFPDHIEGRRGPPPGGGRAGPGRGRTFVRTAPVSVAQEVLLPPPNVSEHDWLAQHSMRKQWQTGRIEQVEGQLNVVTRNHATEAR